MTARPTLAFSRPDTAEELIIASKLIDSAEVRTLLAERGGRMDAVARLHGQLAGNPGEEAIDLGEYLRDISGAVVAALSSSRVNRLHFTCAGHCALPPERALLVGFIVVELVTNAVKYAHPTGVPGEIKVACTQAADGTVTLEVSDDGVGLPEGLDPMRADSLGLQLVRSLAAQLSARVRFAHDALGLSCVLQIPGQPHA
jgi:two-component sensor histidine kinase